MQSFCLKLHFSRRPGSGSGPGSILINCFGLGRSARRGGGQCVPKSVVVTAPTDLVFKLNLGGGRFLLRIESNYRSVGTTTLS